MKSPRYVITLNLAFALLAGCGGGGGSNESAQPLAVIANPDTFYIADQDTDGVNELYQVDSTKPGVSRKLNSPLVAGGDVESFLLTPDGSAVLYRADQLVDGQHELFLVEMDNPGVSVKVNPDLVTGGEVERLFSEEFTFSSDGNALYYAADQETEGTNELFRVELDAPGIATKMSSADVSGTGVRRFVISDSGDFLVYLATQNNDSQARFYRVDVASPGNASVVNLPLDPSRDVRFLNFRIRPGEQSLIYTADEEVRDKFELYQLFFNPGPSSQKLSAVLPDFADAQIFRLSDDGERVFYFADQETDGVDEVYQVFLSNPGVVFKMNADLTAGAVRDYDFQIASDNSFVTYRATQDDPDFFELYRGSANNPGVTTKLNGVLTLQGDQFGPIYHQFLAADDDTLIYLAEKDTAGVKELYRLSVSSPGISTKISGQLPAGHSIGEEFRVSEDGKRVVFLVESQTGDGTHLYQVHLDNPGVLSRLSSPLVSGGNVGGRFGYYFRAL